MLRKLLFVLTTVTVAWFSAVAAFASMVGPVQLCVEMFQRGLCSAIGVQ